MITSKLAPLIAILLVAAFIIPGYVSAASPTSVSVYNEVRFDAYAASDELANTANDSEAKNPTTWNPTYQGIWMGGATKESLFQLNAISSSDNKFILSSEFTFSSSDIMSGASEFVVRLPFYIEAGMVNGSIAIWKLMNGTTYSYIAPTMDNLNQSLWTLLSPGGGDPDFTLICTQSFDPADVSIYDNNNCYVRDNREYVLIRAPIESNQRYLFTCYVQYPANYNFKVYMSQDDICNDNVTESWMNTYVAVSGAYNWQSHNYSVDLGWSFDFRQGMGGGVMAKDFYLSKGTSHLTYIYYLPTGSVTAGYNSVMIPFYTTNKTARFSLSVKDDNTGGALWTSSAYTYKDYILVGSGSLAGSTDFFNITITSEWNQWVRFYFINSGLNTYRREAITNITGNIVNFALLCSYLITSNAIPQPDVLSGNSSLNISPMVNKPVISLGGVLAVLGMAAGIFLMVTGVGFVPGLALFGTSLAALVWYEAGQDTIVGGWMKTVRDAAWGFLSGIGQFLYSVGEFFYKVFQWVVQAIMEYGAILLGLVIVGVALLLFFYPIHYQAKIWNILYLIAQGKTDKAGKSMDELSRDIEGKAGKARRLL